MAVLMAAPALVPFIVFALVPIGYVVYLSFTRYNGVTDPVWVGIENYTLAIKDARWWASVGNTFVLAAGTILIEIPLSLLLATFLNSRLRGSSIFRTIYFVPYVVSIAVMGVVFFFLLRPVNGAINGLLQGIGVLPAPVDWLGSQPTAMGALIAVSVWAGFGINTVFFLVGLQTIPRELYESADIDGANKWQQFISISLPMLAPVFNVVLMLSIVFALRSFDIVKTLTDGGPAGGTEVMFTYIFDFFFGLDRGSQYGYASALAVIASIIIAIISMLYVTATRRRGEQK
jgi:raffinose/stachyose/melibiose transport system permease protein